VSYVILNQMLHFHDTGLTEVSHSWAHLQGHPRSSDSDIEWCDKGTYDSWQLTIITIRLSRTFSEIDYAIFIPFVYLKLPLGMNSSEFRIRQKL